jgi:hypothetical protein
MDLQTRLVKTAKGRDEIERRSFKLPGRLRTLLIVVDGTRSIEELTADGVRLGAPDDALILLMREGFVAPVSVAGGAAPASAAVEDGAGDSGEYTRFRAAKQLMNDTAVDNMGGLKKFTFTMKLERCSTRPELAELVEDYELSLTRAIGKDAADVLVSRVRALLR